MPRRGPPTSGYERIAQDAELSDSDDDESSSLVAQHQAGRYVPILPTSVPSPGQRHRSNSTVDIKVINARLEKWADQIANKFKFKKDRGQHEHPPLEILHSVFVPPEGYRDVPSSHNHHQLPDVIEDAQLAREQFDEVVESVRTAISKGIDPKLIKQGSSGSYFMRDSDGRIVAVFKPKDEEPYVTLPRTILSARVTKRPVGACRYGKLNPKMMKARRPPITSASTTIAINIKWQQAYNHSGYIARCRSPALSRYIMMHDTGR